jgi:hypothetical protein
MKILSTMVVGVLAGALIAGCGSAPIRTGKANDHVISYRTQDAVPARVVREREVVYVNQPVYYQPVVPAYRVISADPEYSTVTTRPVYQRTYTTTPMSPYYYSN